MPSSYITPHGFSLETSSGESIIDVSCESDLALLTHTGERVYYIQSEVTDVFDCETEDHLDPVAWYDEWIKPLKGE